MSHNRTLFEEGIDIHPLFFEQDGNTDITGDWINCKHYAKASILLHKAGTEDVDTGTISFQQASSATGTGAKAVNCRRAWFKQGAMTAATVWTAGALTTPDDALAFGSAAGSTVPIGTLIVTTDTNTDAFSLLAEIQMADMDFPDGFNFLTAFMEGDEVNNTVLYSCFIILHGGYYPKAIPLNPLA